MSIFLTNIFLCDKVVLAYYSLTNTHMHTNTRRFLSGTIIAGMMLATGVHAASTIGTGSVEGSGALSSAVTWDDAFPGTATGVVNGLAVKARINPTLNMVITGSGVIDLGEVSSSAYSTGTVNIEVGTNAVNGSSVTARSTNGGLQNASNPTVFLNSLTADEVADSYRFTSALDAADDSSYSSFAQTAALAAEVNDNTTNHVLYTSNKPQSLSVGADDFLFSVSTKPDAQSPAGDYTDVVVVTVTGNF